MTKKKSNFLRMLIVGVVLLGLLGSAVFVSLTVADKAAAPPDGDMSNTDAPVDDPDDPNDPVEGQITFSIGEVVYSCIEGTTWAEFAQQSDVVYTHFAGAVGDATPSMFLADDSGYVRSDHVIRNGAVYTFREWQDVSVEVVIDGETETYQVCEALTWADYFSKDLKGTVFDSRFKMTSDNEIFVSTSNSTMYLDLDGAKILSSRFVTSSVPYTTDKRSFFLEEA